MFLMLQTSNGSLAKSTPALTTLRGEVRVDELIVPPDRPRREVRPGDYCRTGEGAENQAPIAEARKGQHN